MSQTGLVMCIHFFTRLQKAAELDVTYSLPPDLAVNLMLLDAIYNDKNVTLDYRGVYYKTRDET